ncbi:MAG: WYL domain-containing protein [Bacilli bacterium]|nr:WYL domain-containing protein [Bacilli bacterium]
MSKLSNTLIMLELLMQSRKYSVNELATILEVTPRMVRIYKEDLEKAGIYIDTIMGPNGGYILNQNIKLPIRNITQKDINLLKKIQNKLKDKEQINLLIKKLEAINNTKQRLNKEKNSNTYNIVSKAIKHKLKLKIKYYSFNKGDNIRIIDPIQLFLFQDGWYVVAFCELRNDIRHFELKRIKEIELLNKTYE